MTNNKFLLATMGIPGSGKTYATHQMYADAPNAVIINPDAIRAELTGDAADQSRNAEVFQIAHQRVRDALADPDIGIVVFDATNTKRFAREALLAIASEFDTRTTLLMFDTDYETCCERNSLRERTVPDFAMVRMQAEFLSAKKCVPDEPWGKILRIISADEEGVTLAEID